VPLRKIFPVDKLLYALETTEFSYKCAVVLSNAKFRELRQSNFLVRATRREEMNQNSQRKERAVVQFDT
jgi:hypothetical protein